METIMTATGNYDGEIGSYLKKSQNQKNDDDTYNRE